MGLEKTEQVNKPAEFVQALRLHDVRINNLVFDIDARILRFFIDDILANCQSLIPDVDELPCVMEFVGVTKCFLNLDVIEGVRISDASVVIEGDCLKIDIELNEGGNWANGATTSASICFSELRVSQLSRIRAVMKLAQIVL